MPEWKTYRSRVSSSQFWFILFIYLFIIFNMQSNKYHRKMDKQINNVTYEGCGFSIKKILNYLTMFYFCRSLSTKSKGYIFGFSVCLAVCVYLKSNLHLNSTFQFDYDSYLNRLKTKGKMYYRFWFSLGFWQWNLIRCRQYLVFLIYVL